MTLLDPFPNTNSWLLEKCFGEGREIPIFNYLSYNFVLNSTIDL